MITEIALWIIAWFVVSEIVYVFWYRHACKREVDTFSMALGEGDWILVKFFSFMGIGLVFFINGSLILGSEEFIGFKSPGYIILVWEFILAGFLTILFIVNKLIAEGIENGS